MFGGTVGGTTRVESCSGIGFLGVLINVVVFAFPVSTVAVTRRRSILWQQRHLLAALGPLSTALGQCCRGLIDKLP